MTGDPVSPDRLLQLGYAYREVKALLSAVELGVFTALSHGPLPLDALRETTEVHPRGARDFFDALVALGLLQRDANDLYSNTPATARYLDRSQPTYLGGELEFINAQLYARWNDLSKALRSGKPQTGAGAENYAVRYADPDALKKFTRAMTAATMPVAQALADAFAWHDYTSVIDIGTAEGCLPVHLAQSHAHLSGGGFDLPPIAAAFDTYVQSHDLSSRLRFWPGDFLKDALPSADVLIMGRVLHNWDAQTKTMLLRKAHDALPTGGALIIYERLIDDARCSNATALLSSLNMLLMTSGGFDFSGADCAGWMRDAGFKNVTVRPLVGDHGMVFGLKAD